MSLSSELISQFVKITNDVDKTVPDKTLYGTAVEYDNSIWVKIDGSDQLTPIKSTTTIKPGDRVMVEIANHNAIVTGNLSSPSARQEDVDDEIDRIGNVITDFEIVIAGKVDTIEFNAEVARIEELRTDNVVIKKNLTAAEASIKVLEADYVAINEKLIADEAEIDNLKTSKLDASIADITYATISELEATNANINNLDATYAAINDATVKRLTAVEATIDELDATYATIEQLEAEQARITDLEANMLTADSAEIKTLQADVADIDTLIFGSVSGNTIQSSFANAVIAQLGNAQIKSAMIENVSASKITSGDIITNNVRVMSQDGSLIISDETIQISDDARVRVQIGKDAANDYSINIWDADGNLMFSEGGITDSAIKDAIIRNDMVASDANIAASKLNISSLFTEINNSTETFNANKVLIDTDAGTLDVVFTQMSSDIDELSTDVSSQGTALSVVQGQISSKIWQQDIDNMKSELDGDIDSLSTQYSEIKQDLDGISATVANHTTQISNKADSSTVTEISNRVTSLDADLDGFKTTVSNTYATKTALAATDTKVVNAQTTADTAKTNAANAQTKANEAAAAAEAAQTAADDADAKAAAAAADLATAKQNLANVTSRVGATEAEVAAAQQAVATAQAAADKAKSDAAAAQSTADTAKANAATAKTAADNAKTAADNAQKDADAAQKAADDAQAAVDALAVRVTTAETNITQNSEQIALRATKTEVATMLGDYSTTEEMQAAIELSANEVKTTVSNTYATKTALSATDTKAVNAATAAANAQSAADDAQTAADNAQSTANTANSTANTAKSNAATARSAAEAAQSTADTAKTNAATAQSTADTAKTNAAAAQTAADNAQADVDALAEKVTTEYATKSEVTQTADSITATVSATYATKSAVNKAVKEHRRYYQSGTTMPDKPTEFPPASGGDTLTWDGNTEGLTNVGGLFFKVSDATPTIEEIGTEYIVLDNDGNNWSSGGFEEVISGLLLEPSMAVAVVYNSAVGVEVDGVVFPETGTYFLYEDGIYASSFTIHNYTGFGGGWIETEPEYTAGNIVYTVACDVFIDGTFTYSDVSKMGAYDGVNSAQTAIQAKADEITQTVDGRFEEVDMRIIEQATQIRQDTSAIVLSATENLVKKDEFGEYQENVSAQFETTAEQISMTFNSATEQIGDVNSDLQTTKETLSKHFEFSENGLVIKAGENTMTLTIDNDIIVFKKNGVEFGWWDGVDFHTGNIYIEVTKRAQFGNFAFVPRSDGSLMLLKVGG